MPRTENCSTCGGSGAIATLVGPAPCEDCAGNGYTVERSTSDPLPDHLGTDDWEDIDLTATTPPPGRMANQTWRILEEQRQAAEDTIRECDAEIERWTNKMVDAMKAKGMCEAGQRALDGGL